MTKTVERTELISPEPAEALRGLLGVPVPDFEAGPGLPLLWHWVYLLERLAQADLGPDGHPSGGIPAPPGPGRRRMFAGGRVHTLGTLSLGQPATRRTFIRSTETKDGRSGRLEFVTVAHEISQGGKLIIAEEQDIVYRDAAATAGPAATAPATEVSGPSDEELAVDETRDRRVTVDPVMLFRFSALTYNAHRIHYDRDYAREVEGYPDLVVHGPLQALLMAEAARALGHVNPIDSVFEFRLTSPLFEHQGLIASAFADGASVAATIRDSSGRTTATGLLRRSR